MLLQNSDDLLFRKAAALHALVLVWATTNFKLDYPRGARSAIAGVAELIRLRGSKTLERAKRLYGDRAATRVTVPSRILEEGVQEIDGVVYDF